MSANIPSTTRMTSRLVFVLMVLVAVSVDAGYYDDFHEAVEIICRNHKLHFADVVHFHDKCKKYDSFVRLELSPKHNGYGLVANRRIERGDLVLSEVPIFVVEQEKLDLDDDELARYVEASKLPGLSAYELDEFWRMSDGGQRPSIRHIVSSNGYDVNGDACIFPKISRINHSCRPSLEYTWDTEDRVLNVFAITDIDVNEEVFVSYVNNIQPKKERQEQLKESFNFTCQCELCVANDSASHDANLSKLSGIFEFKPSSRRPEENVEYLESLLDLVRAENLEHDSLLVGMIYAKLVESLLAVPPEYSEKRTPRNLTELAEFALDNLTLTLREADVLDDYPIFEQKFEHLIFS